MSSPREIEIREKLTRSWLAAEPAVRAYVAAAIKSTADREDVLQQVALTVARRFEEYDGRRPFVGWVLWLAKSRIVDHYRSSQRQRLVLGPDVLDRLAESLAATHDDVSPRRAALDDCLATLTERSRALVRMRYHDGLAITAIAHGVRSTPGSVRVALFRIREALADCIGRRLAAGAGE
ncbi:MAG: sigma-70 family RNA polymerase sigma factor [Planctomycetota bacterium]